MASNFEIKKTTKEKFGFSVFFQFGLKNINIILKRLLIRIVVNDMFAVKQDAQPQ